MTKHAWRNWLLYNGALLLLAAGVALYLFLLRGAELPFRCLFAAKAHLYCPGCGCTRALEALLSLNVAASLSANPMALCLLLTLLYYEVMLTRLLKRDCRARVSQLPAVLFAYALLGFFLLRNLLLICWHIDPLGDLIQYWR
jgi:hypothetical protein